MSAFDPLQTSVVQSFCIARCLLDHLIGRGQQRFRDREAKRLGGLEFDAQLELGIYHPHW
jgi:hypothetical protein